MPASAHDHFQELLLDYSQQLDPAQRAALERRIWDEFGDEKAVLVLDMSGFSSLTDRYGVVHYLSMVHRMQLTATPIVHAYSGVKHGFTNPAPTENPATAYDASADRQSWAAMLSLFDEVLG